MRGRAHRRVALFVQCDMPLQSRAAPFKPRCWRRWQPATCADGASASFHLPVRAATASVLLSPSAALPGAQDALTLALMPTELNSTPSSSLLSDCTVVVCSEQSAVLYQSVLPRPASRRVSRSRRARARERTTRPVAVYARRGRVLNLLCKSSEERGL